MLFSIIFSDDYFLIVSIYIRQSFGVIIDDKLKTLYFINLLITSL